MSFITIYVGCIRFQETSGVTKKILTFSQGSGFATTPLFHSILRWTTVSDFSNDEDFRRRWFDKGVHIGLSRVSYEKKL